MWFGSESRPVFGWIHYPEGSGARAAVVICPSLGLEAGFSHWMLRRVARRLSETGFLVIRFDYDGTGDSAGDALDGQRVDAWQATTAAATDLARSLTDAPIVLVGFRFGCLLAAHEAATSGADSVVLWDPVRSGRAFLREQRTRQVAAFGDPSGDADVVSGVGVAFDEETVRAMPSLKLTVLEQHPVAHGLVLGRGEHPGGSSLLTSDGTPFDYARATDQDDLLLNQKIPWSSIDATLAWFDTTYAVGDPWPVDPANTVDVRNELSTEAAWFEEIVPLGPHDLFGIRTVPRRPATGPTLVFVPDAHTPHSGLSRMWTEIARSLASEGFESIRFDLSGCGDSETQDGSVGHRIGLVEHIQDVDDVLDDPLVAGAGNGFVLIGTCSGSYLSLEAALRRQTAGLCLINPAFAIWPAETPPSPERRALVSTRAGFARPLGRITGAIAKRYSPLLSADESFDWNRWLERCFWQSALDRRWSLPERAWTMLNSTLLSAQPHKILAAVADTGAQVLLVASDEEYREMSLGAADDFVELARRQNVYVEIMQGLDHSALQEGNKDRVVAVVRRHLRSMFQGVHGQSPGNLQVATRMR